MAEWTFKQRVALALMPPLAAMVIRAIGATLRFEDVFVAGAAGVAQVERGDLRPRPAVFAFWHRSLLLAGYRFRGQRIAILISRSFDGELIARTVERLGFVAVRGSSSRGGGVGLRGLERAYRDGLLCALTADGPRGPAQEAKPGAAQLAMLVGAPYVGAFALVPERAWTLRSWDRFLIPKPFSRVVATWPADARGDDEVTTAAVQAALDEASAMAARALAARPLH